MLSASRFLKINYRAQIKMTILITGGAKRLGRFLALHLVKRGYKLAITYKSSDYDDLKELRALGIDCLHIDLTDEQKLVALIEKISTDFSDLNAIIHNAALWIPNSNNLTEEMHNAQKMYKLHIQAPLALNLGLAPILAANGSAKQSSNIIHITDAVVQKAAQNHIAYAATKAGLEHLTKSLARKFAPSIRVNSIAPALLAYNEKDTEAYKLKVRKKSLLEPAPGFKVAADAVEYLLDNQYVTGTSMTLDGGRSCL